MGGFTIHSSIYMLSNHLPVYMLYAPVCMVCISDVNTLYSIVSTLIIKFQKLTLIQTFTLYMSRLDQSPSIPLCNTCTACTTSHSHMH